MPLVLEVTAHEGGAERWGAGGECVGSLRTLTCGRWTLVAHGPWSGPRDAPVRSEGRQGPVELCCPDFWRPQGSGEGSFPLLSSFCPPQAHRSVNLSFLCFFTGSHVLDSLPTSSMVWKFFPGKGSQHREGQPSQFLAQS
ncbi:hypothetical protein HJG60_008629 [Phyllostomus discolor]|uniref:Uncharacterized protein n=1 Tax=Phyllostomus discolor TaxID=89673 RepID=A0A833Z0H8_9CHIR|nr:hypothetical protein HJG60_008629 [Phyllostomus discolor]